MIRDESIAAPGTGWSSTELFNGNMLKITRRRVCIPPPF
jgi:hypothetical protein